MLVLARSTGQSVVLDDRITITVLGARGTLVRLGIDAAPDVAVRRGELEVLPRSAVEGPGKPAPDPARAEGAGSGDAGGGTTDSRAMSGVDR